MTVPARIGVVLVGVGRVPEALRDAAQEVLGPQPALEALHLRHPVDLAAAKQQIREAVARLDAGRGVLLVADLCGSSVANLCYDLARERAQVDVLCGANLAMMTKLYSVDRSRGTPTELARALADTGRRGISLASDVLAVAQHEVDGG